MEAYWDLWRQYWERLPAPTLFALETAIVVLVGLLVARILSAVAVAALTRKGFDRWLAPVPLPAPSDKALPTESTGSQIAGWVVFLEAGMIVLYIGASRQRAPELAQLGFRGAQLLPVVAILVGAFMAAAAATSRAVHRGLSSLTTTPWMTKQWPVPDSSRSPEEHPAVRSVATLCYVTVLAIGLLVFCDMFNWRSAGSLLSAVLSLGVRLLGAALALGLAYVIVRLGALRVSEEEAPAIASTNLGTLLMAFAAAVGVLVIAGDILPLGSLVLGAVLLLALVAGKDYVREAIAGLYLWVRTARQREVTLAGEAVVIERIGLLETAFTSPEGPATQANSLFLSRLLRGGKVQEPPVDATGS